jgi:predicted RNA binding protein YcfA (HicA-like mRNA interferase family)
MKSNKPSSKKSFKNCGPIPAITGKQLITLLEKDGWRNHGKANHGISMSKNVDGRFKVTVIPTKKNRSLPDGTLGNILGVKQTGLGKKGLRDLKDKYGLT